MEEGGMPWHTGIPASYAVIIFSFFDIKRLRPPHLIIIFVGGCFLRLKLLSAARPTLFKKRFREIKMRLIYADLDLEYKARVAAAQKAKRDRQRVLPVSPKSETRKIEKYPEVIKGQTVDIII